MGRHLDPDDHLPRVPASGRADGHAYTGAFDLTLDVGGIGGSGQTTGTGTYATECGVITTTLGSSDLVVSVSVGGVTLDGSDLANGILTNLPINNAPYDCAGPTLSFQAGADASVRHDVTLTPA